MVTLLIADDSMFQRFSHAKVAKEEDFFVLEAKDGAECISMATEHKPDILLLDLNMPGKSGVSVLEELNQNGVHAKVLVVTADIQDSTRERCLQLGAKGFLNKPVEEKALRSKLKELLD